MSKVSFILTLVAVAFAGTGFFFISAASVDEQLHDTLMGVITECNKTHTVDMNDIVTANVTGNFPDTATFKCMMRCILEGLQIGTEEQGYDPMKMALGFQMIRTGRPDKSNFYDISVDCLGKQKKSEGKCEKAYHYASCLVQEELKINGPL